jgi:fatty acid CoA ligase FadD9
LKDVPELGYFSEDRPHPRGELWVKSADTVAGYFKDPVATSSAFDEDGFFCTGDIVEMDTSNDTIKIIDRRKHFFKLAQGEYVAPERLEKVFLLSPLVRFIYIYAESLESYVLAVVVPQQPVLEAWATKQGIQFSSFAELCQEPAAVAEIMKNLAILADDPNNKIQPFELPRGVLLEPEPFTVENELLTSTFKLKRLNLQRKYKTVMREMYDHINERMMRTRIDELRALIAKHVSSAPAEISSSSSSASVPLTEWGLDSLSAIRLSNVIKSEFGVTVAAENLATGKTSFDSLVKLVTNQNSSSSSSSSSSAESFSTLYKPQKQTDWKAAVQLGTETSDRLKSLPKVDPFSKSFKIGNVFLTGSTGFLGVFLLADILKSTSWKVHCLIRAKYPAAALTRMRDTMIKMVIDLTETEIDSYLSERIDIVHGDLALPRLGLSDEKWANLGKSIDLIIHNGCRVNTVFSYDALEEENVGGTRSCLNLASEHHLKPFVYISTLSAIGPMMDPDLDGREFVDQTFDPRLLQMMGGYGSTKRVSELLVDQSRRCGLPTMIVRPGTIGAHSKTGACNLTDYHTKLLCGIRQIACAPESKQRLDMIPVDYLAAFVIGLVRKNMGWSEVFHAYEEAAAPTMIEVSHSIIKRHSNVRMASFAAWRSKLQQHAASEEENALYPLLHYFNGMDLPGIRRVSKAKFNMHLQLVGLQQLQPEQLKGDYLDRQLEFLYKVGLIPKPNH